MKIAVSTDQGKVSAHFGRCPQFTILEIDEGQILKKEIIDNPGHHPGFLPAFLSEMGVKTIIAGGMGPRAKELFEGCGIGMVLGVEGKLSDIERQLLDGTLQGTEGLCRPGAGKGYGLDKSECEHRKEE